MTTLNMLYSKLLGFGMLSIREALDAHRYDWASAEVEFLHNLPSLLDEANPERHRYFWFTEREQYIRWVKADGSERVRDRMRLYYEPLWTEMEQVILKL